MRRGIRSLLSVLGVILVLTAAWAYRYMGLRREAAIAAQLDLAECVRMGRQIEQFGRRPTLAAEYEQFATETISLIENAAKAAGISAESISRITPEPPRRIDDTIYKEKPTQVLLRRITLKQLTALTHGLLNVETGLRAKSIRLSAPRNEADDRWTAELVLTYLIYDPPRVE